MNVYFILLYHFFFVNKFNFSNVYISVNTIFECLDMLFWSRKGPSIKYVRNWQLVVMGGHPKYMRLSTVRAGVTPHVYLRTYTIFCHVFGSIFVL